ncbi:MAG: hypothetical protein AB7K24_33120, partial [Gemmataceae bacterium]
MAEIIQCPYCRREVNLPLELIGKTVQCPECGVNFIAVRQQAVEPGQGEPREPAPDTPNRDLQEFEREVAYSKLRLATYALLVVGILGLLMSAVWVWAMTGGREAVRDAIKQHPTFDDQQKDQVLNALDDPNFLAAKKVFLVMNLVIIIGSVLMLQAR